MLLNKLNALHIVSRRCLLLALTASVGLVAHASTLVYEGKGGWLFPVWESHTEVKKALLDANQAHIQYLSTQLAAKNIKLMVMVIPMKASYYPDKVPADKPVSPEVLNRYNYVLQGLAAAGIPSFDVVRVLRGLDAQKIPAFIRTDYHWTAYAAEASADAAAELIRKQVHFTTAPSGGSKLGEWLNERHYGDLAMRYLSSEQRMALKRDVFHVRATSIENQSLLDDEPAQVHVVGNSFVQPYLGFTQKLSEALNRPVSLTWKFGNVGPWMTMLSYLESEEFRQNKPLVVLWQLNEPRLISGPQDADGWDAASIMSEAVWRERVKAAIAK